MLVTLGFKMTDSPSITDTDFTSSALPKTPAEQTEKIASN